MSPGEDSSRVGRSPGRPGRIRAVDPGSIRSTDHKSRHLPRRWPNSCRPHGCRHRAVADRLGQIRVRRLLPGDSAEAPCFETPASRLSKALGRCPWRSMRRCRLRRVVAAPPGRPEMAIARSPTSARSTRRRSLSSTRITASCRPAPWIRSLLSCAPTTMGPARSPRLTGAVPRARSPAGIHRAAVHTPRNRDGNRSRVDGSACALVRDGCSRWSLTTIDQPGR
jgi:hypothetical protein